MINNRVEYGIMVSVFTEDGPHHCVVERTPYEDKAKEKFRNYAKSFAPDVYFTLVRRVVTPWETMAVTRRAKKPGNSDVKTFFIPNPDWEYED